MATSLIVATERVMNEAPGSTRFDAAPLSSEQQNRFVTENMRRVFLLIYRIIHSPFGEVLKAIRENEPRAISLGYDVDRYKLLAGFVLPRPIAGPFPVRSDFIVTRRLWRGLPAGLARNLSRRYRHERALVGTDRFDQVHQLGTVTCRSAARVAA